MNLRVKMFLFSTLMAAISFSAVMSLARNNESNMPDALRGCRLRGNEYCALSYYELIAKSDQFDGVNISFIGYLGIDQHKLVIYSSQTAYEIDDQVSSVEINGDQRLLDEIYSSKVLSNILVFGKFSTYDGRYGFGHNGRLGAINISFAPNAIGRRVMDRSSMTLGFNPLDETSSDDTDNDESSEQK